MQKPADPRLEDHLALDDDELLVERFIAGQEVSVAILDDRARPYYEHRLAA